ncbi:MAG TPA: bifunctional (p)ppGpp synthetase/guanosine-3',5'-bis(diphosphate) 3'-pyrophosphohydrolase [Candidatus Margulisiibacteriota bacterium]|nr:bifunctional (p)ppGpp synthetase/guanosine-3',5'-bis(diphosphate) 3'-pyrophosphohydrolase [Candidatus Margulisiibacteriota bacterium]
MNLSGLIERVRAYEGSADTDLIARAYDFSAAVHKGQKRASGEPYLTHPVEVAGVIAELKLDVASVVTALLHDTVEDTLTTLEEIEEKFGAEIAALVDGVTKISQINFTSREEKQAENFRKMLVAMARDIRVILVKLADRTHNMRTLESLSPERQHDIAQETLDIYAPLAHRLGIYWMKSELEDNSLRYLHPEVYYQLKRNVAKKKAERERYIKEVIGILSKRLDENDIEAEITGRPKHFYSIYQKMQAQNLLYDQIYDLVAFRVIVGTLRECYAALGVIHAEWKPIPGRFKDYIALPKANMYQSLHTTVIGPYGERMEVQIRTHEMHRVAEAGIAAHWRYKGGQHVATQDAQRFTWLRQLLEWQQHTQDPQEFLRSVKDDLFSDEVFVFTPQGDLLNFPEGSTVIDFAYRIHSEVGAHCAGARVNGRMVPLRYHLRSGDTVEIITTATQTPSKDWLNFVKTSRAQVKIRNWIKYQQRTRSVAVGREILGRDLNRYHLDLAKLHKDGRLAKVATAMSQKDEETLLASIGYGKLTSHQVLAHLLPPEMLQQRPPEEGTLKKLFRKIARQNHGGVRVSGVEDMLIRFGKCCDPLPGERILGFVTRGRGVTVHAVDCPRVLESDTARRVEAVWENGAVAPRAVTVDVMCVDEPGLLAAISKAISSAGVNISRAQVRSVPDKKALNTFEVVVSSADQLNRVIRSLGKVRGVMKVARARG